MSDSMDREITVKLTTDIIVAYLAQRVVEPEELPTLVRNVRLALEGSVPMAAVQIGSGVGYVEPAEAQRPVETPTPAVPIEDSVTPDYILSLEDGKPYRSLRRHLMARYGLTPDEYRRKWGLPSDYPMAAPNYAQERSEVAKRIGLGRGAKAKRPVGKSAKSGATPRVRRGA